MGLFGTAGAALGIVGDIFGFSAGAHQRKEAAKIHPVWQQYQTSPYAKQQYGLAQQLFNGAMPGFQQEQQNIANSQANYLDNAGRNATDSAQLLALGGLATGATNNAYDALQTKQGQYKMSLLDNLNKASDVMIGEGDKSYQSMLQKFLQDTQTKNALMNNGVNNQVGAFNNAGGTLISYENYLNSGK